MTVTRPDTFKYAQVSRYINELIEKGDLKPGDKAPSLRKLSKQLGVSIATVTQSYVNLEDQGILTAKPQSGFYVNALVNQINDIDRSVSTPGRARRVRFGDLFEEVFRNANNPRITPFGTSNPSMEFMPVKSLTRATRSIISRYPQRSMDYLFPPGDRKLREQIAQQYAQTYTRVSADDIIITSGATEALSISLRTVAKRGDIIAVESPTYFAVLRMIEQMGMLAVEIDTDPVTGLDIEALEEAFDTMDIKAVMASPNTSNPLGCQMPEERKRELVNLLAERDIPLIEDDVYGSVYFGDKPPRPAKSYDLNNIVLSCSSFSKTLAPGHRVGWVIAGRYHKKFLQFKQAWSSATSSINQLALAEFLSSGQYDRHLARLRVAMREQVERGRFMIAKNFPEGTRISHPHGGNVLWVEMPEGCNCIDIFNRALEHNIAITPGILFSATRRFKNHLRINCGSPWNQETENALITLGKIVCDCRST
ncbi:MAG: PLP-dependent aminotransferase family protein [Gammaproteobacteria bacterium]|nr:MAG: PLP-dependent aminotransferase family protein [Gammaproteobacteria bacterium]UCH39439.1 MAG: PLP-dependent aminotransferase family protein [Gammaproteobacteria bacterium]